MIDWERVSELRGMVGEEDFAEVVTIFLDEVDDVLARLGLEKTSEGYRAGLHLLKGSALNLGFRDLAALCHSESSLEIADIASRDEHRARLLVVFARSKEAFLTT
jgi:HPt (histidine-containing phosphotransfer) domain-containing protein